MQKKNISYEKKQNLDGYLFILPNLLFFLFMFVLPFLYSFYLTFTDGIMRGGIFGSKFVGLLNYKRLFGDEVVWTAIYNNALYTAFAVIFGVGLAFVLASLLNKGVYLKNILRTVYFMPYISASVAVYIVWYYMFSSDGPINAFLHFFGIGNLPLWMLDERITIFVLGSIAIWTMLGYNVLIYLAALQAIPTELFEASTIDGANMVQTFKHIVYPMVRPTTFFLLLTNIIATVQNTFALLDMTTKGRPGRSTTMLVYYIFEKGFKNSELGYASTIAILLFVIVMLLTLFMWNRQKKSEGSYG